MKRGASWDTTRSLSGFNWLVSPNRRNVLNDFSFFSQQEAKMMARIFITIFLIIRIGIEAQKSDPKWAKKLNDVLQVRDSLIGKVETLKKRPTN